MAVKETIIGLTALVSTAFVSTPPTLISPLPEVRREILAEHQLNLTTRHKNPKINELFSYNILLTLHYFGGGMKEEFKPATMNHIMVVEVILEPEEIFAFHENVLPEFKDQPLKTGWTKYTKAEGYKTALGLPGNGVCHLASLMNWTAQEVGFEVVAKTDHNFYPIPGVPKKYGASIRYTPDGSLNSPNQNLYVKNNFDFPVIFMFKIDGQELVLSVIK